VFNRGFWDGYYLGQRLGAWTSAYGASTTKKRVHLGICLNHYPKAGVASFRIEAGILRAGEEVLVTGPTTGALSLVPEELRLDDRVVPAGERGMEVTFRVDRKVRRGDVLYRMEVVS